jgi:hypothetical protein
VNGVQIPRVRSVPAYVSSRGQEVIEVARTAGLILDPFQQLVLVDACGCLADGKWSAQSVGIDLARQNGKGGITEARQLAGVFAFGEQLQVHSAHEFPTATEAMGRMEELLAGTPEFASQVKSVSRSHGSEGFVFKSGQRIRYRTRTKGGGRGFSVRETLYLDEAMILQESFIAALLPTLSAQSMHGNPQIWYTGTAVDQLVHEHGQVFARIRARGISGDDPTLAWFGWSAVDPFDSDDKPITPEHPMVADLLDDARTWAAGNPSLGIRISEEYIAEERRSMDARTFAVERLGIGDWPAIDASGEAPISVEAWKALEDPRSQIVGPACFAFDVTPDRRWSTISVTGLRADGLIHGEVVERRRGTGWVVDRMVELVDEHEPVAVVCDQRSPAMSLVRDLEAAGVEVTTTDANEHAEACGLLFDLVEQDRFRHLGTGELAAAIKGAVRRPLGDAWGWSRRKSAVDISPIVSVTLAAWGTSRLEQEDEDVGAFMVEVAA